MQTRGGRIGSGMGTVMESLYGYYLNQVLSEGTAGIELGWMANNEYNDFACVSVGEPWDPKTRLGELLRLEAKATVRDAAEAKAHFDEIQANIGQHDGLLVLGWEWTPTADKQHRAPIVVDWFIGRALDVAELRDQLHVARGNSFVESGECPDGCPPGCRHVGEPLNNSGKRERKSGPNAARVSQSTSHAQNFGGLIRMLKTDSPSANSVLRDVRWKNDVAHRYISFVDRFIPKEELNRFSTAEWREFGEHKGFMAAGWNASQIRDAVATVDADYRDELRAYFKP